MWLTPGKAHNLVHAAIEAGRLPALTGTIKCRDCGKPARVYDHRDYSRPLKVVPVCHSCNTRRGTAKNKLPKPPVKSRRPNPPDFSRPRFRYNAHWNGEAIPTHLKTPKITP